MAIDQALIDFLNASVKEVTKNFYKTIYDKKNVSLEVREINTIYQELPFKIYIKSYFRFVSYTMFMVYDEGNIQIKTLRLPMVNNHWEFMKRTPKLKTYRPLYDFIISQKNFHMHNMLTPKSYNKFAQLSMFRDTELLEYLQNNETFRKLWLQHCKENNPAKCKRLDKHIIERGIVLDDEEEEVEE